MKATGPMTDHACPNCDRFLSSIRAITDLGWPDASIDFECGYCGSKLEVGWGPDSELIDGEA